MHRRRVVALDEVGRPSQPRRNCSSSSCSIRARTVGLLIFIAVEVQDRQHGAVADRIEELVGLPRGRERARFSFAVADDTRDHEVGIIEGGPEGVAERVPKLTTFVNRTRRRRGNVAGYSAGERELLDSFLRPASS